MSRYDDNRSNYFGGLLILGAVIAVLYFLVRWIAGLF